MYKTKFSKEREKRRDDSANAFIIIAKEKKVSATIGARKKIFFKELAERNTTKKKGGREGGRMVLCGVFLCRLRSADAETRKVTALRRAAIIAGATKKIIICIPATKHDAIEQTVPSRPRPGIVAVIPI